MSEDLKESFEQIDIYEAEKAIYGLHQEATRLKNITEFKLVEFVKTRCLFPKQVLPIPHLFPESALHALPMPKTTITTDDANKIIVELRRLILALGGKFGYCNLYGHLENETLDYVIEMNLSLIVASLIGTRHHENLGVDIQLPRDTIKTMLCNMYMTMCRAEIFRPYIDNGLNTDNGLMITEASIKLCRTLIKYMVE